MKLVEPGIRQVLPQHVERLLLLPLLQRHFQLELAIEMVFDDGLVAAGDEDEMFDAGLASLIDDVLDQRPVDHRQHLLGHGLGGRQEPGAEPGDGKDGFAQLHLLPLGEKVKEETRRDALLPKSFVQVSVQVEAEARPEAYSDRVAAR